MRFKEILQENYQTLRAQYSHAVNEHPTVTGWFGRFQPKKTKFYDLQFETAVDAFEYLVKNNLLKDNTEKKSTQYWISEIKKNSENVFEFGDFVLKRLELLHQTKQRKSEEKNYSIIYQDSAVKVYEPHSHEASVILGKNTKWCTTSKDCDQHYRTFSQSGDLYYIHVAGQPSPNHKLAVYISHRINEPEYLNAVDEHISEEEFVEILKSAGADVDKVMKSMEQTIDIEEPEDNVEYDWLDLDWSDDDEAAINSDNK